MACTKLKALISNLMALETLLLNTNHPLTRKINKMHQTCNAMLL